jgi:hypothetical protein
MGTRSPENERKEYFPRSIIFTLLLQIPVFFFLWIIDFEIITPVEEVIELDFISPQVPVAEEESPPPAPAVTRPAVPEVEEKRAEDSGGKLVKLPRRRMVETDVSSLSIPFERKLPVMEQPGRTEKLSTPSRWSDRILYMPEKPLASKAVPDNLLTETDRLSEAEWSGDVGRETLRETFFELEGAVSERGIIQKIVPEYPPELQKEARIRLRFYVLPDGRVGQIIPLRKADPDLESVSIEALRSWRFSPVQGPATEVQEGIITFIYRLK